MPTKTATPTAPILSATATAVLERTGDGIATLHSNRNLRGALAELPGYADAAEALNHAVALRDGLQASSDPRADFAAMVVDEARRGPIDADALTRQITEEVQQAQVRARLRESVEDAASELASALNSILSGGMDRIKRSLHTQLVEIVGDATPLAKDLTLDAESALRAGRAEQWEDCRRLVARYRSVREVQRTIDTKTSNVGLPPYYETLRHIRNVLTVHPDLAHWEASVPVVDWTVRPRQLRKPSPPPWPTDPAHFLGWLAESDAEPWVPTSKELEAAGAEYDAATRNARKDIQATDEAASQMMRSLRNAGKGSHTDRSTSAF